MLKKIYTRIIFLIVGLGFIFLMKMVVEWYVLASVKQIEQASKERIEQQPKEQQEKNRVTDIQNQIPQNKKQSTNKKKNRIWLEWYVQPDGCDNWQSDEHMVQCVKHRRRAKQNFDLLWGNSNSSAKISNIKTITDYERAEINEIVYSLCIDEYGRVSCIKILDQNPTNLLESIGGISVLKSSAKKWENDLKIVDGKPVAYNKLMRIIVD